MKFSCEKTSLVSQFVLCFIDPHFTVVSINLLIASVKGTLQELEKNILAVYLCDPWCHYSRVKTDKLLVITTL